MNSSWIWRSYVGVMGGVFIVTTCYALRSEPIPASGYATSAEVLAAISRLPENDTCSRIIKAGNTEALRQGARFERASLKDLTAGIEVCRAGLSSTTNG